jgi:2-methylisocitrate lyase-like PEP mutase family enzyme
VVEQVDGPVNANVAGGTAIAALAASGVSRISIGPMAFHSAVDKVGHIAAELLGSIARSRV